MNILVTREFFESAAARIGTLRNELDVVRRDKHTAYVGDTNTWHDNFEYESLTRQEKQIEAQLFDALREMDGCVVFDDMANSSCDAVAIGTIVEFNMENVVSGDVVMRRIVIVPHGGEDYSRDVYNYNAPLILPLIGAGVGDERRVRIPMGEFIVRILSVSPMK